MSQRASLPTPTHARQADRTLLAVLDSQARVALPQCAGRIDKAVSLVLHGDVTVLPDGTATVSSQTSPLHSYHVNGHCTCPDAQHRAPEGWCKHRIARGLALRLAESHRPVLSL